MELLKLAQEIGFFELGINLTNVLNSEAIWSKAGAVMPLPEVDLLNEIERIAGWLASFGKSKYMFLTPELALIEHLAALYPGQEAIMVVSSGMESDIRARLWNNLPKHMRTSLLDEVNCRT